MVQQNIWIFSGFFRPRPTLVGQINDLYAHTCEHCGGHLPDLSDEKQEDWEVIYDEIAKKILDKSASEVNADLHLKTAEILMNGVRKSLGENLTYGDKTAVLVEYLQRNIYAFSAAKSFTEMKYYRDMMIEEEKGGILDYGAFKKKIAEIIILFCYHYV